MTHYTTQERADEMSGVLLKVEKLVAKIEAGGINNIGIFHLLNEDELNILSKNGICNTDRTAKQIRNQIKTWFRNHRIAKFHIQAQGRTKWFNWNFADTLEEAQQFAEKIMMQNPMVEELRILNNFSGDIYMKQGANWIEFPKK